MTKDKNKPKCVLFDADGVIIQKGELMSKKYVRLFNTKVSEFDIFFTGIFKKCVIGKADLKKEIVPYLKKWGWKGSLEEFLSWWFEAEHCIDVRVLNIIKQLKKNGVPVYLVTNQEKYRGAYMRTEMKFDQLFDKVFISAEVGSKKPSKEFYKEILRVAKDDCGASPEEVLFFDDDKKNVKGAKDVGIDAYFYQNFERDMQSVLAKYWYTFKHDDWNTQCKKITLGSRRDSLYIKHGDVWWNRFGQNIGFEQDGKNNDYSRPVLVIKTLSKDTFLGAPLTTANYDHKFRIKISDFGGKDSRVIISQMRTFDKRRLEERVGRISKEDFANIRKSIKDML